MSGHPRRSSGQKRTQLSNMSIPEPKAEQPRVGEIGHRQRVAASAEKGSNAPLHAVPLPRAGMKNRG